MAVESSVYSTCYIMFLSYGKKINFCDVIISTISFIICSAWTSFKGRKGDSLVRLH